LLPSFPEPKTIHFAASKWRSIFDFG